MWWKSGETICKRGWWRSTAALHGVCPQWASGFTWVFSLGARWTGLVIFVADIKMMLISKTKDTHVPYKSSLVL